MLSRLDRRNVSSTPRSSPGRSAAASSKRRAAGRSSTASQRLPAALAVSLVAGSRLGRCSGIGGGILQVPTLIAWCGVPLRAAAATSALMIGITALASVPIHYARGTSCRRWRPRPCSACCWDRAPACGSAAGRGRNWLKMLMAAVLALVSAVYFMKLT